MALALTRVGGDGMKSRLSTYLHPLAGRPLAYHVMRTLAEMDPPPSTLVLVGPPELHSDLFREMPVPVEFADPADRNLERLVGNVDELLIVDSAAPTVRSGLERLRQSSSSGLQCCRGVDGRVVAVRTDAAGLRSMLDSDDPLESARCGSTDAVVDDPEACVVRSRAAFARVAAQCRDRIVERQMAGGVTFLLPESVWVDVDVSIGRDTLVYPNVILEEGTTIGEESVIGPGCRLIGSWIGSGVELKGWNYISHTSVRNRAILEPYVRRGYD